MAKTAAKLDRIVDQLRSEIVGTKYPPSSRLPTRIELEKHYKVSSVTIQRALDRLVAEGFVEARGRRGTFVVDSPPHLSHYGVVFPSRPHEDGSWSQVFKAIRHEAQRLGRGKSRRVSLFYGVQGHGDIKAFRTFCGEVVNQQYAGLFFGAAPFEYAGTPILDQPGVPRVAFQSHKSYNHVTALANDDESFMRRSAAYFHDRGCRKLGVLTMPTLTRELDKLRSVYAEYGIETQQKWLQCCSHATPQWSRNIMNLMMSSTNADRPDCILVRDDNLLPQASLGLRDAGVGSGNEVEVISLYNFPLPTESAVPVTRLGFDAREMLSVGFDMIDALRAGAPQPDTYMLKAYFEHELDAKYRGQE